MVGLLDGAHGSLKRGAAKSCRSLSVMFREKLDLLIILAYIWITKDTKIRSHFMKTLSISKDIVPIAEFKAGISKWFKSIQNAGRPLIITQNGKPAGVLLSPSDYDELVYKKSFLDSVGRGMANAESGKVYSTQELKAALIERRNR